MRIQNTIRIFLILFAFAISSDCLTQESTSPSSQIPGYDNVISPSPEVSALFKFIKTPVNYYTGVPDISIPIYTVKEGDLEIPIVLRYHAGGIKVNEISSWVGVGWALETGGVIGREVVGIADDNLNGFYYKGYMIPEMFSLYDQEDVNYLESIVTGSNDSKPDFFSYSMPGGNGRFVFGNDQSILLLPQKKHKINVRLGTDFKFDKWMITNEAGTKYYFGGTGFIETTESTLTCNTGNVDDPEAEMPTITSWMLNSIASANSHDSIFLTYKSYEQIQSTIVNETDYLNQPLVDCPQPRDVECTSTTFINGRLPEYIRTKNIDIRFYSSNNRPDLNSGNNGLRLDSIEIVDKATSKKIRYCFSYDNQTDNRLWLTSLTVKGENVYQHNKYSFNYNHNIHLPARDSKNIDHWGYYNGQNNSTLLPCIFFGSDYYEGADREVYSEFSQAGMLTRITYPTKGYTDFTYESNNVYSLHTELDERRCLARITALTTPGERVAIDSFQIFSDEDYPDNIGTSLSYIRISAATYNNLLPESNGAVYVYDKNGNYYFYHSSNDNETVQQALLLRKPGWYYIKAEGLNGDFASISVIHQVPLEIADNRLAGGIRIKEITNVPVVGLSSKTKYEYTDFQLPDRSSGTGGRIPRYEGNYTFQNANQGEEHGDFNDILGNWAECSFHYRTSNPQSAFNVTQGAFVGYKNVRIIDNNSQNGYTENTYTSFDDFPDLYKFGGVFPVVSKDYKRGLLLESRQFDASGNMVSKIENSYSFLEDSVMNYDNPFNKTSSGLVVIKTRNTDLEGGISICDAQDVRYEYCPGKNLGCPCLTFDTYQGDEFNIGLCDYYWVQEPCDGKPIGTEINMLGFYDKYFASYIDINSEFIFQTNSTSTQYFPEHDSIVARTDYFYDNRDHYQVSRIIEHKNSKIQISQFSYAEDYSNTTGFIGLLKSLHIHNKPIEKITYITDISGNNTRIIDGIISKFSSSIKDQLDTVFLLQPSLNKPISLSNFKFSNSTIGILPGSFGFTKGNFQFDNNYKAEMISDKYDLGRIAEYHKLNDKHSAIIWGYNNAFPIAKLENATYLSVTQNTVLRNYLYQLQNFNDLADENERSSLKMLNNNIRNNLPANSLVTTYTNSPLYGITSETDPNGVTTYYEYDGLGRLKCIRNDDGNIIKTYDYHYQE